MTETRTLGIDTVAPTITIYSPQNITYNNVSQASLQVSANETVNSWWYKINGGSNTTFSPNITINIANGSNILFVYANDSLGNIGKANVSFMGNYPTVTYLNSPADGYSAISSVPINITFNCSAVNDVNLANITLYINGISNETKTVTGIWNFSIFTKTIGLGAYTWTCRACDYASQCSFGVPTRTFIIISPRLIDNLGIFANVALLVMGAGIILLFIDLLFTSEFDLKTIIVGIIGVIIIIAVLTVLV